MLKLPTLPNFIAITRKPISEQAGNMGGGIHGYPSGTRERLQPRAQGGYSHNSGRAMVIPFVR